MKIAIFYPQPFFASLGTLVRVRELVIGLNKLGNNVTIWSPYEKRAKIWTGINVEPLSSLLINKFPKLSYRISSLLYYNSFVSNIFLNKLFSRNITKRFAKWVRRIINSQPDVLQIEHDISMLFFGKIQDQVKLVVDIQNTTLAELVALGIIKRGSEKYEKLRKRISEALSNADKIIVDGELLKIYVHKIYDICNKDIIVIPPLVREKVRTDSIKLRRYPPKICYAGQISYREHVDLFIKSMPEVLNKREDANFYITNKGEHLKQIRKLVKKLRINSAYFYWFEKGDDFYKFLSKCHVGVLPSSNDLARKIGTPIKLFDYMSVGLPIVANDIGAWTDIIKQHNIGIVVGDDPKEFANAILDLINDPHLAFEYGSRGLKLVSSLYNLDNSIERLVHEYKRLIS